MFATQELELGESNPELWTDRDRILILVNSYEQSKWVAEKIRNFGSSFMTQIGLLYRCEIK